MMLVIVAAVAENGAIGNVGCLPWRLKSDLAHFRKTTLGKPVLMGRKTYLSIGKPLGGRTNIVLTRERAFAAPGVVVATSMDAALTTARGDALRRGAEEIMIIGGADVFRQTMGIAQRLVITWVHLKPAADIIFPPIDPALWREVSRSEHPRAQGDDANFAVVVYERPAA